MCPYWDPKGVIGADSSCLSGLLKRFARISEGLALLNTAAGVAMSLSVYRPPFKCRPGESSKSLEICIYIHINIPTYLPACLPTYPHTYIHTYIHARHTHTCMHTYTYIHSHTYMNRYIPACVHTYVHTYTYTYIRTYIHRYIHTYIRTYIFLNISARTHLHMCTYIAYSHVCMIHTHAQPYHIQVWSLHVLHFSGVQRISAETCSTRPHGTPRAWEADAEAKPAEAVGKHEW